MRTLLLLMLSLMVLVACTQQAEEQKRVQEMQQKTPAPDSSQEAIPMKPLTVTSPAFQHNGTIPSKYTCDGQDINPPLTIANIPEGTKTFALIVDDPDAPRGNWDHWIVWNIPPGDIAEDSVPGEQGMSDFGRGDWGGPCPPSGVHRYFFKVYALDTSLRLSSSARKADLLKAMDGHILAKGELIGKYSRK